MEESRRQYVARAPSSSLLGLPSTAEKHPDTRQFGGVDIITLRLKEGDETTFVGLVSQKISCLSSNVSWFVAKSCDEPATWVLLETSYLSANHSKPIEDKRIDIPAENDRGVSPSTQEPLDSQQDKGPKVIRQPSGLIEVFRSVTSESMLTSFLASVTPLTRSPPVVQRSRMIVSPWGAPREKLDTDIRSYLFILRETAKTKIGQQKAFIESCEALHLDILSRSTGSLLAIEVHQDLDASTTWRLFCIFYYFETEAEAKAFRDGELWRRWRRSVAPLLEGPPRVVQLQGVFDSRPTTTTTTTTQETLEGTRTAETVATPTEAGPTASPSAVVQQLAQSITRMRLATATSVESLEDLKEAPTMTKDGTGLVAYDSRLAEYTDYFRDRFSKYMEKKASLLALPINSKRPASIAELLTIHKYFGIYRKDNKWVVREWIPNAQKVYLFGEFNNWDRAATPLSLEDESAFGPDVWTTTLPLDTLTHRSRVKLHIVTQSDKSIDRIPPSSAVVWKDADSEIRNGVVWSSQEECYTFQHQRPPLPEALKIYEAYVGLAPDRGQFGTYNGFRKHVLPRIHKLGYNTLILLGVAEHSLNTLGWHVTNFLAPTSAFGTPEELKELVDAAHGLGISVLFSVIHGHASPSSSNGLAEIDGTDGGFFRSGGAGQHRGWDALLFDYEKPQVCRFLLSQLSKFMEEFRVDGFRFDGTTSMLYHHHGIGKLFHPNEDFGQYFSYETDDQSAAYLMLANDFIHSARLPIVTIASESSQMPSVAVSLEAGGLGFDYRSAPRAADAWITQLQNGGDDNDWSMEAITGSLEYRPAREKIITFAENWSTSARARRPLLIAMFAWESLHTHAVGGVAPHVTELAAGLARLGHQVHVFVRATGTTAAHNVHYGVHYHECPFRLNPDFVAEMNEMCNSFVWHMGETEAFLKRRFDICHAHDWLAANAMVMAKRSGHACIQSIHSTEFGRCGNKSYGGESKRISDIEHEACHIADRVICVSGVLASEVTNLYNIQSQKIEVVYNGINAQNFDGFEDAAPIKASYGISPMEPMFLFVGRMAVQKGPDLLIEAIPHVLKFRNDTKFVIVGDGYMMSDMVARARQLGIEGSCRFTGSKSGAALKSLFKACDAVVVPSRNEPFGIVVLEAWSAYKPVVATTCGGPRDFVTPNVDGVLVDPSPSSIAWGCCEILKNFEHARWMGERGRVKAAFSFSWDQIAKRTEAIYLEQLNKHDAPYSENGLGDCSLAFRLAGPSIHHHMGVFDGSNAIYRTLALHKMIRLVTCGLGGQGYLNFMGNEFGHPDYVDVPRGGNGFSFVYTNRRYDLPDDKQLKYKHFEFFDACLMRLETAMGWLSTLKQFVVCKNEADHVLAFERGNCLFIANFHPYRSYEGYAIGHSLGTKLRVVFDTDEPRFGGFGRLQPAHSATFPDLEGIAERDSSVKLYLPSRTAMILVPEEAAETYQRFEQQDPVFKLSDADQYIALQTVPVMNA